MLRATNGDPEEEKELLSDCSDSESESGSSSTSDTESVKGFLVSSDESNDKHTSFILYITSSSDSKTYQLDSTDNEEDSDDLNSVKDKMENLNILSVKN
ncbi:unnamed protein product, partial [Brachionus calyciflorus]